MTKFNLGWPLKSSARTEPQRPLTPVIEGQRLELRPPSIEDYPKWSTVRAANQEFLTPFEPEWAQDCLTEDFFIRRLKRQARDFKAGSGCYFFIHHKDSRDIIGGINLNDIKMGAARHASLGYWIDQDYQGQGYMLEAGKLIVAYAFDILNLRRLNAGCLPDNERSVKLLLRLGFEEEGYAKKYLQINGKWQDHRLFGLVNEA